MASKFENLFEQLLTSLQVAEKRHRVVRDSASDSSDWNTYDSESELISNIIKWRRSLEPLRTEIAASVAISDEDVPDDDVSDDDVSDEYKLTDVRDTKSSIENISVQSELHFDSDDEIKVGKYIRGKLRELSRIGYVFSATQIQQLCDTNWSKSVFTYPILLPFAKKYNNQHDISVQIKDENGKNRYWNEVFRFGDIDLLIISQWYAKDKESFDKWYEGLPSALSAATNDMLVFRKTVDWSTLNYAISIPVSNWDSFFNALGKTVSNENSCNISIEVRDVKTGDFKASVANTVSGTTKSVQIRYTRTSKIVNELRRIFKITFDYCNNERCLDNGNSRVIIPADLEEYIDIYATGTPNTLRFVCSPIINTESAVANVTESESANVKIKPVKITLLGKEYPIKAWNEMFVKVCEVMLLHSPYIMAAMDKDKEFNTKRRIHFSYIQSEIMIRGKQLSNGLWIETNENSGWILNACRKLLDKCGFSPDEIQVETVEV